MVSKMMYASAIRLVVGTICGPAARWSEVFSVPRGRPLMTSVQRRGERGTVDDEGVLARIEELSLEEFELEESHHGAALSEQQRKRLRTIEVQLDQCYDLLRQRRARRSAGLDPEGAGLRQPDVVENYLQ